MRRNENAIVERSNKETMRHLRALLFERSLAARWSEALPLVQRLHNSKKHITTGVTPTAILFGNSIDLDTNLFLPDEHRDIEGKPLELSTYMIELLATQDQVMKLARANIAAHDERNLAKRSGPRITDYPNGSWVLYSGEGSITASRTKLDTLKAGPFQVKSHEGSSYVITDVVNHKDRVGYPTEADSWEQFSTIRDTEALHK